MDLGAYIQIDDLSKIAEQNGIKIPRLRGYRTMADQTIYSIEEINDILEKAVQGMLRDSCFAIPKFSTKSCMSEFSKRTYAIEKKYIDVSGNFRWGFVHGKRRKNLKFAVKKKIKAVQNQYETWNKYAGRKDVLYIHARIGGKNWDYYGGTELEKQPWFLEKIDDWYDSTYCDIYAKIGELCTENTTTEKS